MSVASSTRSLSFAVNSARAAGSAGARRISATSIGNIPRRSSTASSTVSVAGVVLRPPATSPRRLAKQRGDQPLPIGTLLLQRLDEESQSAQRLGEKLEVFVADRRVRVRVAVDLLFAKREQVIGVVLLQHLKCAADLVAVLAERRDLGALRRIAEERVEHLLHPAQVDLDLARDLREQDSLLRAAEYAVDQRPGPGRDRTRFARRVEPREHRRDLLREIAREAAVVRHGALGEQDAGRVLHREHFRNVRRRRHRVETIDERRRQLGERLVADGDAHSRARAAASRATSAGCPPGPA